MGSYSMPKTSGVGIARTITSAVPSRGADPPPCHTGDSYARREAWKRTTWCHSPNGGSDPSNGHAVCLRHHRFVERGEASR